MRLFRNYILLAIALLVGACKTQQPPVMTDTSTIERTEKEIPRDTVIKEKPDSAAINALLVCDSLNNVLLKQLEVQSGDRIKPTINIVPQEDGTVKIAFECKEDSLRHEIQLRDKLIETLREQKKEVPVYVEKPYKQFLVNSGIALWVLIALLVAGVIIGIVLKFAK